jgi:cbb3-type cytochrome oxidase subunit 3
MLVVLVGEVVQVVLVVLVGVVVAVVYWNYLTRRK